MSSDPTGTKRLPARWSEYLNSQPETGMGYQTADVVLQDGTVICDVAIIQSELIGEVRGHEAVTFDPEQIAEIRLTHNEWQWRT